MRPSKKTPLISLLISFNHLFVIKLRAIYEAVGLLMLFLFTPDADLLRASVVQRLWEDTSTYEREEHEVVLTSVPH